VAWAGRNRLFSGTAFWNRRNGDSIDSAMGFSTVGLPLGVVTPNTYNIRTQYTNRQPAQLQSQQSSPVGIGPSWLLLSNEKGQYPISHFGLLSSLEPRVESTTPTKPRVKNPSAQHDT
jgi:hypothetical protein